MALQSTNAIGCTADAIFCIDQSVTFDADISNFTVHCMDACNTVKRALSEQVWPLQNILTTKIRKQRSKILHNTCLKYTIVTTIKCSTLQVSLASQLNHQGLLSTTALALTWD